MDKPAKHFYEFGPFLLDASRRRLLRGGEVVPLTPKAFDTLLALVEQSGRVVEKDDLMERVWPGVAVEENNLTQNVSALRKALGERREEPQYIATVPGLGYRFIASVSESRAGGDSAKSEGDPARNEGSSTLNESDSTQTVTDESAAEKTQTGRNGFEAVEVETQRQAANLKAAAASNTDGASDISTSKVVSTSDVAGASRVGVGSNTEDGLNADVAARARRRRRVLVACALAVLVFAAVGYYLFARRARRAEAVAAGTQVRSIAVLPFK